MRLCVLGCLVMLVGVALAAGETKSPATAPKSPPTMEAVVNALPAELWPKEPENHIRAEQRKAWCEKNLNGKEIQEQCVFVQVNTLRGPNNETAGYEGLFSAVHPESIWNKARQVSFFLKFPATQKNELAKLNPGDSFIVSGTTSKTSVDEHSVVSYLLKAKYRTPPAGAATTSRPAKSASK